jgi:hypothetical protein
MQEPSVGNTFAVQNAQYQDYVQQMIEKQIGDKINVIV